jgi:undecaprenyl pyrophosphate phosphatase UppP
MAVLAVCSACGAALTAAGCARCAVRSAPIRNNSRKARRAYYTGFWQRFLIATIPAAVLALFVESTVYGYILYLGVYLTYLAWAEATAGPSLNSEQSTASSQRLPASADGAS